MKTWIAYFTDELKQQGKPLQRSDFRDMIAREGLKMTDQTLGVLLNRYVSQNLLGRIKFDGFPSFYCHPSWIKEGQLINEFDPIFKEWKKDQINYGIKN